MRITPMDPGDDDLLDDVFRLVQAVHAADTPDNPPPLREELRATLRQDVAEHRLSLAAVHAEHQLAGIGLLVLPTVDNQHLALLILMVAPALRRQGGGRALFAHLRALALQEGRTTLQAQAVGPAPGGPHRDGAGHAFLAAMGFARALESKRRRVDLTAADPMAERRLAEQCAAHAADYTLTSWLGHAPQRLGGGLARLVNLVNADAPTGDLDFEASTLDDARLRAEEQSSLARGNHLVGVAAIHRSSDEPAALTRVDVRPPGDHGNIWLTVVDRAHRGHRLGTLVKLELHQAVRRQFPGIQYLSTVNADANAQMVAINERLGYVAYETVTNYQRGI